MRADVTVVATAISAGLAGCTVPGIMPIPADDPARAFGLTHYVRVNAPDINDIASGEPRALALANQACGLAPSSPAETVNLQMSQALGAGRLYSVSCPAARKDMQ